MSSKETSMKTTTSPFPKLSGELEQRAKRYGYHGLFATRKSMQEAYTFGLKIAEASEDTPHVATAIQVLVNTYAIEMARLMPIFMELEEMTRAALSYCQDGSRSDRRRMRMIHGAQQALAHAKPYIEMEKTYAEDSETVHPPESGD
jgi:hypothetical protein